MGILQNIGLFENIKIDVPEEINWCDVLEKFTLLKSENEVFKNDEFISSGMILNKIIFQF